MDAAQLAEQLLEKLAADERFRGPPGPAGPPGPPGPPGKDAPEVDRDQLVAAVLEQIDYQRIADLVHPSAAPPAEKTTHYVVVGNADTSGWDRILAAVRYAQARYQGLAVASPPSSYTGPLPVLVRYVNSVPQYVARGQYPVEQSLAALARGGSP